MKPELLNGIFAVAGAIIGAVLTAFLSRWNSKKDKKEKILSIFSTFSTRLIEVSDLVKNNIEIKMNDKPINELYKNEILVINTGNLLIDSIQIDFELYSKNAELMNIEMARSNFNISEAEYSLTFDSNKGQINISYLNPSDEIIFILLSNKESSIDIKHRQQEVTTVTKNDYFPETPGIILKSFFDAMSKDIITRVLFSFALPDFRKYLKLKKNNSRT
ncbi:hypothetical protein LZF95_23410 [Algoriphagus sp. AGSA1]|uniref:hypothetical protein n=1 Tax=Algoriphagus sp. AGSA1 TaxID=2907213 RepID=UPI001F2F8437|nr:hypothetical protein [Algoriphagus sp. AGSA1]MCE7057650.1 hypothetical protein [Algoriphagus sp. AGSA1]